MLRALAIGAILPSADAWGVTFGARHAPVEPRSVGRASDAKMCGILAISGARKSKETLKLETLTLQRLIRHRGPDGSGIHVMENDDSTTSAIAHERLAIMDPLSGNQPLFSQDNKYSLAVNGEIYNYKELRAQVGDESKFRTNSDCEPIVHLYEQVRPRSARVLPRSCRGDHGYQTARSPAKHALGGCLSSAPSLPFLHVPSSFRSLTLSTHLAASGLLSLRIGR